MRKKYLLPPLKVDSDIQSDQCWVDMAEPYDFLLRNLKLRYEPGNSIFDGGSNAMPHLYEQMLIFHRAFLDERHPEHRRAVAEWRAVLLIMALQKICNLNVNVAKVELSPDSPNAFIRAAAIMQPEESPVFYNTTWEYIYVLLLNGSPVAMFSPVTLVCPAKLFIKKIEDINWITIEKVNGIEQLILGSRITSVIYGDMLDWLKKLESELNFADGNSGADGEKFKKVKQEIFDFAAFCEKNGGIFGHCSVKEAVYSAMNKNLRKEFSFLNSYCEASVMNEKLRFLQDRYQNDIFQEILPVIVYDNTPNSMLVEAYNDKLDQIFPNIFELNGQSVLDVRDHGGMRIAARILLPFKEKFVEELNQRGITPYELFESFTAVYDAVNESIEVSLKVKEYLYRFEKIYKKEDWKKICANNIPSTYVWPTTQINVLNWQLYYVYTINDSGKMTVTVPGNREEMDYDLSTTASPSDGFRLIRSGNFPAFLKYTHDKVAGFLPVKMLKPINNLEDGKLSVFINVGHATSSILMIKDSKDKINFTRAQSLRITGYSEDSVNYRFIPEICSGQEKAIFKNMLHSFLGYTHTPSNGTNIMPFDSGVVLFDHENYQHLSCYPGINFINFEYSLMEVHHREQAHLMIEQLLLYIAYQAVYSDCSYLELGFLHEYQDGDTRLGELRGLWSNAFDWVRSWTGIKRNNPGWICDMQEYKALAYVTYHQVAKKFRERVPAIPADDLYVGIDIGWKNTQMVVLSGENDLQKEDSRERITNGVHVDYAKIDYAGRDISLLEYPCEFPKYSAMLNILLNGSDQLMGSTQDILQKFQQLFASASPTDRQYYEGLFDVIAMKIEEKKFMVPPDVYNNMPEFRLFIKMYTYNILLLFINISYLLKKVENGQKSIHIYMGGNGIKFLKWISHDKSLNKIDDSNDHEMWIAGLKGGILEILGTFLPKIDKIIMEENESLLDGFAFCQKPEVYTELDISREFQFDKLDNTMADDTDMKRFKSALQELYQEVFSTDASQINICSTNPSDTPVLISDILRSDRRTVNKAVIDMINTI